MSTRPLLLLLVFALVGCHNPGGKKAVVEGRVTVRDQSGARVGVKGASVYAIRHSSFGRYVDSLRRWRAEYVDRVAPQVARILRHVDTTVTQKGPYTDHTERETKLLDQVKDRVATFLQVSTLQVFLAGLPAASDTSRTDSTGRYRLRVRAGRTYYVTATVSRQLDSGIGAAEEHFLWARQVSVERDTARQPLSSQNVGFYSKRGVGHGRLKDRKVVLYTCTEANNKAGSFRSYISGAYSVLPVAQGTDPKWERLLRLSALNPDSLRALRIERAK